MTTPQRIPKRLWCIYEQMAAGRWEAMIYTLAFTRQDAIAAWRENQRDKKLPHAGSLGPCVGHRPVLLRARAVALLHVGGPHARVGACRSRARNPRMDSGDAGRIREGVSRPRPSTRQRNEPSSSSGPAYRRWGMNDASSENLDATCFRV